MRSILDRADELAARADELAAAPAGDGLHPIHLRAVEVLSELMTLGGAAASSGTAAVPTHLRLLMRTLEASRPMLLDGLRNVPPARIREFMADLRDKIDTIVTADDEAPADAHPAGPAADDATPPASSAPAS